MKLFRRYALLLIFPLLAVACADERPAPNLVAPDDSEVLQELTEVQPQEDDTHTITPSPPRVRVSLDAEGSFRPGQPITITVAADAQFEASDADLRIILPEVEAARRSEFGDGFKVPTGIRLPDHGRWNLGGMVPGQRQVRTTTVTIPHPGYYRVVAVTGAEAAPDADDDPFIVDKDYTEDWIFVTDTGGAFTDQFERDRIPEGAVTLPGPMRGRPTLNVNERQEASIVGALISTLRAWFFQSGEFVLHAQWFHPDSSTYGPATGVTAKSELYYQDSRPENLVTTEQEVIGSSGYYTLPCEGSSYIWHTWIRGHNSDALDLSKHGWTELWNYQCADTFDIVMPRANYNAFIDLRDGIPYVDAHLNKSRSRIDFSVTEAGCGTAQDPGSCYTSGNDQITFNESRMLNWDHTWVSAHEYGHALHEESLGELWSASNCQEHWLDSASSYRCAQKEGFADYLGTIATDSLGANGYSLETPSGESGVPDGKIERHVAATFWDLTDSNADNNDATDYSGEYIANVFWTCEVLLSQSGWKYQTRISDMVWCLENRTNSTIHSNRFPGAPLVTDQSETASEPTGWDADSVRATWTQNLEPN